MFITGRLYDVGGYHRKNNGGFVKTINVEKLDMVISDQAMNQPLPRLGDEITVEVAVRMYENRALFSVINVVQSAYSGSNGHPLVADLKAAIKS